MTTTVHPALYTIGHSTRSFAELLEMLQSFDVKIVVDVRSMPGSRKYPQFNQDVLNASLRDAGVQYIHMTDLGGRRKPNKDSENTRWNNPSFRAYADYMETEEFKNAAENLMKLASEHKVAIMCSEAVWWRCHRSMIADFFKAKNWTVLHIMAIGKVTEHSYTSPAIINGNDVAYHE